jgi:hypothetical protein
MDETQLVSTAIAAVEAWDMPALGNMLADDFVYRGTGKPLDKQRFLAVQSAIGAALPDLKLNASKMRHDGDRVWVSLKVAGTHLNDLDLSVIGIPPIPATGIYCQLAAETVEYTVADGKITHIHAPHSQGSGIPGLLSQIGVEVRYTGK